MHIEQALAGVPKDSRCKCREAVAIGSSGVPESKPETGRKWWPFG
jgi:hypothetical protein